MDPLKIDQKLLESISSRLLGKGLSLSLEDVTAVADLIKDEIVYLYVNKLITQLRKILGIDPSLTEREILQFVAKTIVEYLGAEIASIGIYDPERKGMISYVSYPSIIEGREEVIPFEETIADEVVKKRQSYLLPNILKEERYKNKEKVEKLGIRSMLAVPIYLHRFSKDADTEGVLQIYYKEEERGFTPLEVEIAEMISKSVGYVTALKRINYLHKMNVTKDKILEHIYQKLARGEGIKMKDLFNSVIPELADIMNIQRCSLFSVMEDREHVILEAGYPEAEHGIGKVFSIREPHIDAIVNQTGPFGEFENERIDPDYILIKNPRESHLLSTHLKHFLERQKIHLVLYIGLKVNEIVKYFLAFDAQAQLQQFSTEDIEIFTFLGKELMKGLRLEKMGDTLHDFRNPAVAVAGFAKRVKKMLQEEKSLSQREKIDQALDIILQEASYLQHLALTLHAEGKEVIMDLSPRLKRRLLINEEATKELKRGNIRFIERQLDSPLWIRCFPIYIDRVLDNLLSNASNAIPEEGGELSIRSYRQDCWAVAEIINTGQISEEEKNCFLLGDTSGRGLHTVTRLVKHMGGKMEVESRGGQTKFRILIPLANS